MQFTDRAKSIPVWWNFVAFEWVYTKLIICLYISFGLYTFGGHIFGDEELGDTCWTFGRQQRVANVETIG